MKKNEVQLGGTYKCKVSNKIVSVKITHENPHGGWGAKNLSTGKNVKIKSAQRLRGPTGIKWQNVTEAELKAKHTIKSPKIMSKADYEAEAKAEIEATKGTKSEVKRQTGQRGATGGKPAPQPGDNTKPLSLIKAAICVLQSCQRPMGCKEIVDKALDAKIWEPKRGGLTPANTLSAALRREIKTKGNDSRFVMAERGKFSLNSRPVLEDKN